MDALYGRALGLLRPLVEEERTRAERERARSVESRKTRKRLDALEKAANRFMEDFSDEDTSRDPKGRQTGSRFRIRGYVLSPQYAQYVRGQSFRCWLTVLAEAFPEIGEGETVEVECLTDDLRADRGEVPLEPLDGQEGVLRATWSVKALEATPATGLAVRVGPIEAESTIAVLASEAERYWDLAGLRFERPRYRIRGGSRRHIRLLAPKELVRSAGTDFALTLSSDDFHVSGARRLTPKGESRNCRVPDSRSGSWTTTRLRLSSSRAWETKRPKPRCALRGRRAAGIVIRLEDVDHGALRYRWNRNVLEIGARHPSLQRYLGRKAESYPGQDHLHFRVLLAGGGGRGAVRTAVGREHPGEPGRFRGHVVGRLLPALRGTDVAVSAQCARIDGAGGGRRVEDVMRWPVRFAERPGRQAT